MHGYDRIRTRRKKRILKGCGIAILAAILIPIFVCMSFVEPPAPDCDPFLEELERDLLTGMYMVSWHQHRSEVSKEGLGDLAIRCYERDPRVMEWLNRYVKVEQPP